jgi:hypothetical protein
MSNIILVRILNHPSYNHAESIISHWRFIVKNSKFHMGLMHTSCPWWWLYMEQFRLCPSKKNATKPRHNVQFICTRFLAGGLRKIFRTVRICLFAYKIKKKKTIEIFLQENFSIFYFRPSISIPCYLCKKSMNRKMRLEEDLRKRV